MSNKLCALYARVSTERQSIVRDGSLDTQLSRLKAFIDFKKTSDKKNNWRIADKYREEGKSGKSMDRPKLQHLISDIRSGLINTVIVTKLDRITRSLMDFYKLNEIFERNNTEFISLEENFDTSTPMGKAMLKMSLVWAELEREQTSKRTKEKMEWRAEQGLWNGGQVLGYDLKDSQLMPNKQEAKLIKLMFEKYLTLGSLKALADYLNAHGYRTKQYKSKRKGTVRGGQKFFVTNVKQKLTNPLYLGQITHKNQAFKGKHKAIIDMKLWNKVQKSLDLNMPKKRNAKKKTIHTYILQGLMKCGWCDSYMAPKYSTGRSRLHPYYQCTRNSRFGKSDCQMKYVPAEELEKLVLKQLKNLSHDKKLVRDIVKKANQNTDKLLKKLNSEKKDQENRLKPINEKIDNLIDAISSGVKKTGSINKKMLELEQNKEEIEKDVQNINFEIDKLKAQVLNAKVMHDSLKRFSEICDAATPQELKDLIPHFVEKITWTPSEIKIALFEQEVQRGPITGSVTTSKNGALQVSNWLLI